MEQPQFTQNELVEVGDAISAMITKMISAGDLERHEAQYGTLTLLHEAQAKLLPSVFGFTHDETSWGAEQLSEIRAIRKKQGLPEIPTSVERARWASGISVR
ncbi:hypothetical protein [Agrobacterium tumefaciens]|uniref:hypothetical protein n=1 Tax=Agrobacterium tumefaciens TaxID=358 RepID=UPI001572CB44|nr:hypothetical protein [Agrobacterium tumefaciens]NTB05862.1 hypothetical protein [Agrobacterium tumefaciens]